MYCNVTEIYHIRKVEMTNPMFLANYSTIIYHGKITLFFRYFLLQLLGYTFSIGLAEEVITPTDGK